LRARFREREETVKADVFSTFTVLLQQVHRAIVAPVLHSSGTLSQCSRRVQQPRIDPHLVQLVHCLLSTTDLPVWHTGSYQVQFLQVGVAAKRSDGDNGAAALGQLRSDVPAVLRAAAKQLREKPIKTRMGAFGVLRDLVLVMPEAVTTDPGLLVPGIVNALNVRWS